MRSGDGYVLRVPEEEVDLLVFRREYAAARAESDPGRALGHLVAAEGLWRGEPLAGLPVVPAWEAEISALCEARLGATEDRLGLQIRLGRGGEVVEEVKGLLGEHPYRERLWQHYLRALAAGGRRGEALAAYGEARRRFVAELGVEPGPELRAVQAEVLHGEERVPIRQLPPEVADFTGRDEAVEELMQALAPRPGAFAAPVAVVSGAPGTGKSALAVHVAHRLKARYPEQFYADLGATSGHAGDVVAGFLHALGVFGAGLPDDAAAREALLRSKLVGRRFLVVLDDAGSARQVRALVPADGGCAVLVTSRSRLPGLVGAHQVELAGFGAEDGVRLLGRIAGAERVAAEVAAAREVVEFCGRLPLAIRIAGTRLAGRRAWTVGGLRDRLADESRRLTELRVGDLAVRGSFELSVRQLPAAGVRAFGRFAELPTRDFAPWAVDALLGEPGGDVLEDLVDANLVAAAVPGLDGQPRYRVHELLHCYTREVPDTGRAPAFARYASALLSLVKRAAGELPTAFGALTGDPVGWRLPAVVERGVTARPLDWLATHREALARTVELAAEAGEGELAWQLAAASVPFHDLRGHYDDWAAAHRRALEVVGAHERGAAVLLRGLGQVHLYRDEYADATRCLTRAAGLFGELGDRHGEAFAVAGLGTLARVCSRPAAALEHYGRALDGFRAVGDLSGVAQALGSLGTACRVLGRLDEAGARLDAALSAARELGDQHREAKVRGELGALHRENGDPAAAQRELVAALAIFEEISDERCTAHALVGLAATLLDTGQPTRARALAERALHVFERTGNRRAAAGALVLLARSRRPDRRALGHPA
ncbi:AfsR/SARP family transcriptional regulator [Actinokineospora bangkokensis]|uniref:AfsR/SARP family transcriptional regulator n=1 Tax=Actinokineospora bangkokensis TaxID=1193682 RepID=UPI001E5CC571|nr:BTAD domain-containing putative transcriptional regulator [Actinokineospora bangkokensis]